MMNTEPWHIRRKIELEAAAPMKRKKVEAFVKVPLWWITTAADATGARSPASLRNADAVAEPRTLAGVDGQTGLQRGGSNCLMSSPLPSSMPSRRPRASRASGCTGGDPRSRRRQHRAASHVDPEDVLREFAAVDRAARKPTVTFSLTL